MTRVLSPGDARRPSARAAFRPSPHPNSEPLERRVLLATFTVTTTADVGPGSLRQALVDASANSQYSTDVIRFAIPGAGVQTIAPLSPLPIDTGRLTIDGTTQPGYVRAPLIQIDGANAGPFADGLVLGPNSIVRALAINHFGGHGVSLFGRVATVADCYVGVDPSGERAAGNGGDGVSFVGPAATGFQGTGPTITGNVISANAANGVRVVNGDSLISGNMIGVNASGTARLGNAADGVQVTGGLGTIGPEFFTPPGSGRNVISGNGGSGIRATSAYITVRDNRIGTDASGTTAIGNGGNGILTEVTGGYIGGASTGQRPPTLGNVISGNRGHGIYVMGGAGTDFFARRTPNILGNKIGTDVAGDADNPALGNGGHGVAMVNAASGIVGGEGVEASNTIAFNAGSGVFISGQDPSAETPTRVQVRSNSIFSNGRLGIDLASPADLPNGVTPNDRGDADTGPNGLLNYPELLSARVRPGAGTDPAATTVALRLDVPAGGAYRVEFFANPAADPSGFGEGKTFVGDAAVTVDGRSGYAVTIPAVPVGTVLTATVSDTSRSFTSEFSPAVAAAEYAPAQVVGRYVNSVAIVPGKQALLPGQTASPANVVAQYRGITGVVIDVAGLATPDSFSLTDLSFRRLALDGTTWSTDPAIKSLSVAWGGGVGDSDRVTVTFRDKYLQFSWLEVTVKADQHTGLVRPDVFYFGQLTGESGDAASPLRVTAIDLAAVRRAAGTPVPPGGSPYDFNRDGLVNAADVEIVRRNLGRRLIALVAPDAP